MQPGADDPAALKAIARHADAVATVRAFAARSEALRVVLLVDLGDGEPPVMIDAAPGGAIGRLQRMSSTARRASSSFGFSR